MTPVPSISANSTDEPGSRFLMQGLPFLPGPSSPADMAPRPFSPRGFSALIDLLTLDLTSASPNGSPASCERIPILSMPTSVITYLSLAYLCRIPDRGIRREPNRSIC